MKWTYNTLKQALQDWPLAGSTSYLANLQNIISLGELRLWKDMNIESYDKVDETNFSMTLGVRETPKPTDTKQLRNVGFFALDIDSNPIYTTLEKRSLDYCKMFAPNATLQDVPQFYAELDFQTIYVVPSPDDTYLLSFHYIATQPTETLVATAGDTSTWLSRAFPDALLAACLAESDHYLKADDRYQDWINKYNNELLPVIRAEMRGTIRADYSPVKSSATVMQG